MTRWLDRLNQAYVLFFRFWKAVEADLLLTRAGSMAYITLVSLVPMLLLLVGLLEWTGLLEPYYDVLEDVIFRSVLGELPEVRDALVPGLQEADLSSLGVLGVVGLVLVAGRLVMLVEDAYGVTFGAPGSRNFLPRLLILTAATLGGPLFFAIVAALLYDALTGFGLASVHLSIGLLQWLALFMALLILPATRVRWSAAFVGSTVSAVLLVLCSWAFQSYVAWFAAGNPVRVFFGSLAALPVFLLWLYLVWVSVLIGVEVAAMYQYRRSLSYAMADVEAEESQPLEVALAVLGVLADLGSRGQRAVPDEEISERLRLPHRLVGAVVAGWEARGVLTRLPDGDLVLNAKDSVPLAELARRWRQGRSPGSSTLAAVQQELDKRLKGTLGDAAGRWRRNNTFSSELTAQEGAPG